MRGGWMNLGWIPIVLWAGLAAAEPAEPAEPAEDGDADEFRPGLVATLTVGPRTVERIDDDIAFDWGRATPDQRLPIGSFAARWNGRLLVRQPGRYRLHAFLCGKVRVRLDGREVFQADADKPAWRSGAAFDMVFGERRLAVEFTKTAATARVMLCWSSDKFPLEPIPAARLFRSAPRGDLDRIDRGRRLFAAHRCNRCHQRANESLSAPGPDLTAATVGTDPARFGRKDRRPGVDGSCPHAPDGDPCLPTPSRWSRG